MLYILITVFNNVQHEVFVKGISAAENAPKEKHVRSKLGTWVCVMLCVRVMCDAVRVMLCV